MTDIDSIGIKPPKRMIENKKCDDDQVYKMEKIIIDLIQREISHITTKHKTDKDLNEVTVDAIMTELEERLKVILDKTQSTAWGALSRLGHNLRNPIIRF